MKLLTAVIVALALISVSASAFAKTGSSSSTMTGTKMAGNKVVVKLAAQNNSGETGTAWLWPKGNQTLVSIKLKDEPKGATQPVHIHNGTCAKLNPVPHYGLTSIVNGKSMTTVNVPLASLTNGNMSINVHQGGGAMLKTYVACGTIGAK